MLCIFKHCNIVQNDPEWYSKAKRQKLWWLTLDQVDLSSRWQVACGFLIWKPAQVSLHWKADTLCPGRGRRSSSCWERSGRRSYSWTSLWILEQACDEHTPKWVCIGKQTHCVQDVAEDLPVVEKGVEEEVTAEPEDRASAEQACDEHTPANQIVEGLSQEEGQTFQEFAKDARRRESFELKVGFEKCMSQHCPSMFIFDCLSRVVQESVDDNWPTRPFDFWGNSRNACLQNPWKLYD